MAFVHNEEALERDRQDEYLEREFVASEAAAQREHEYRVHKLKLSTQTRAKALERALVAFAKAPAWLILSIMVPIMVLRGREVPKAVEEFLSL